MSEVTAIVDAAANTVNVTAEVIRTATWVERARQIASAHPIAAGAVGVGVAGLAVFGSYKLLRKAFTPKPEVNLPPIPPVGPVNPDAK